MKFSEKLQKLRKENNMSQEDLADKLDVSRQSVSKWESGQTYPEMDKLLTMCKIFGVTLDDLTNDEIKYNDVKTKTNKTWSNLIDGIVYIIDKSYTMFKNMTGKERGRCIGELFILFIVLLFLKLPFNYITEMGTYALETITSNYSLMRLWDFIINVIYIILFSFTFIYIYKTYYLDKYTIKKKEIEKENIKEDNSEESKEIKEETKKEKVYREPYHFGSKIFETLGKCISYFIKGILIVMCFPLTISFVGLFIALIMMFILICKGVLYFGPLIGIISGIIICGIILKLLMAFIFNYKPAFRILFISFMVGLATMGVGIGISIIEIASTEFSNELPKTKLEYTTKVDEYTMEDNLFIGDHDYYYYFNETEYEIDESLGNQIKIEISYYKDLRYVESYKNSYNKFTEIDFYYDGKYSKKFTDLIIDNLKNKKFYNYEKLYNADIKVIATSANIEKLKENRKKFYESENEYHGYVDYYIGENDKLTNQIDDLNDQIYNLKEDIESLKNENQTLKEKIDNYKNNLNMLD